MTELIEVLNANSGMVDTVDNFENLQVNLQREKSMGSHFMVKGELVKKKRNLFKTHSFKVPKYPYLQWSMVGLSSPAKVTCKLSF